MTILSDISVVLTPEDVLHAQERNRPGMFNPGLLSAAQEAISLGQALAAPASVWLEFEIKGLVGARALLSDGHTEGRLTVGPKADLLAPARRALVAVCTIGPALESRVHELHTTGQDLLAFMLDSVGVMLLGKVGEAVRLQAERRAAELGWGVGPALAPGSLVGWSVSGQRELCALVPLDQIAVRLNKQCMLEPQKSTSMVIGLGPDYSTSHVGSVCEFCSLKETCWRQRGRKL